MRPRQWVKNAFVWAGPVASGQLFEQGVLLRVLITFIAFILLSGATYLVNDIRDVDADRAHPTKRFRPIAAGEVSVRTATVTAVALVAIGLAAMWWVNPTVFVVGVVYLTMTAAYSFGLKNVVVVDLLIVAMGFVLRGLAGVFATPDRPTVWFILLALFGSLLLVSGKRSGEIAEHGRGADTRSVLGGYSDSYLQFVREFAAAGSVMAYSLMAFDRSDELGDGVAPLLLQLSILPFLAVIMLLVYRLDQGSGSAPEDLLLKDRGIQAAIGIWLVIFAAGVYL